MSGYEHKALCYAEQIGVIEYSVNGKWIEYWSFFPGEGFRFIQRNLDTGEENREGFIPWTLESGRPLPEFLKETDPNNDAVWWCRYNYNVG